MRTTRIYQFDFTAPADVDVNLSLTRMWNMLLEKSALLPLTDELKAAAHQFRRDHTIAEPTIHALAEHARSLGLAARARGRKGGSWEPSYAIWEALADLTAAITAEEHSAAVPRWRGRPADDCAKAKFLGRVPALRGTPGVDWMDAYLIAGKGDEITLVRRYGPGDGDYTSASLAAADWMSHWHFGGTMTRDFTLRPDREYDRVASSWIDVLNLAIEQGLLDPKPVRRNVA